MFRRFPLARIYGVLRFSTYTQGSYTSCARECRDNLFSYTNTPSLWTNILIDDLDSFIVPLRTCQTLPQAYLLHLVVAQYGYDTVLGIQTLLLHMYARCRALARTCCLFAKMHTHIVFAWNILIDVHARTGNVDMAFQIFQQMWCYEVQPNQFTMFTILSLCTNASVLVVGEHTHAFLVMNGYEGDVILDTAVVNMYSKCGDLKSAIDAFERMGTRNVYAWSALLAAYAQHGKGEDAIAHFYAMQHQGELPNNVTFISLLDACACLKALDIASRVRAVIQNTDNEQDVVVATALVNVYAKCNVLEKARQVFENIPNPNIISWNAMIAAYAQHGQGSQALQVFYQMQEKGIDPDQASFVSVIDACTGILALEDGQDVHEQLLVQGALPDIVISTALVNMYGKCKSLQKACQVFEDMPRKNVVTWNTIVAVHAQHGHSTKAFEYLNQMLWEGLIPNKITFVSMFDVCAKVMSLADGKRLHAQVIVKKVEFDVMVGTAIVNMYGKCNAAEEARSLFEQLTEKNSVTFSLMITMHAQLEQEAAAFNLYRRLHNENIIPDKITCISILDICADVAALTDGELVHCEVAMEAYELDEAVGTSLISFYGRCGSLEDVKAIFVRMKSKSAATWNSLMTGLAQHGKGKGCLQYFDQMQDNGVMPTDVTFISVLNACSHTGLVREGCYLFQLMGQKYGIAPSSEHLGCMVDLLGRAGLLDEAESLIYDMLDRPMVVAWTSLLGACRHQIDVKRGERAAKILCWLDPENIAPHVILSNMHALTLLEETIWVTENDENVCHDDLLENVVVCSK